MVRILIISISYTVILLSCYRGAWGGGDPQIPPAPQAKKTLIGPSSVSVRFASQKSEHGLSVKK
jgi:hypothetical protein